MKKTMTFRLWKGKSLGFFCRSHSIEPKLQQRCPLKKNDDQPDVELIYESYSAGASHREVKPLLAIQGTVEIARSLALT